MFHRVYMDNWVTTLWEYCFSSICFRLVSATACAFLSYLAPNHVL